MEILSIPGSKGEATLKVKKLTGAHTLITVGDYENDIPMIVSADIGYAVGNAVDGLKHVADRVTVNQEECALAQIIKDLDN